jgi:DNA-binding CsgD family transcriptional regulator/tetratricopeptide (TPR) repeat protein
VGDGGETSDAAGRRAGDDGAVRFARVVAEVGGLLSQGRPDDAVRLARAALGHGVATGVAVELRLLLSSVALMQSRPRDALSEAELALDSTTAADDGHDAAELQCLLARLTQGVSQAQAPAQALLGQSQSDATLAGALTALGSLAFTEGRVADSIGFFRAAVRRADRDHIASRYMHPRHSLAVALTATGSFDEAEVLLLDDRDATLEVGDAAWGSAVNIRLGRLHLAAGRLQEASTTTREGLVAAEQLGVTLFGPLAHTTLAAVHALRGEHDAGISELARARAAYVETGVPYLSSLCDWIEARLMAANDERDAAVELMGDVYDDPGANSRLFLEEPGAAPWLVRLAITASARERAERVVEAVESIAASNREFATLVATAIHARALMTRDGDALQRAVADHHHAWARALACEHCGVLCSRRDRVAARGWLERAAQRYARIGAAPDARRTRAALQALSQSRAWRSADRPTEGWASLTGAESRVVEFVALGMTNAEVGERMGLSRHTVDFHLRHIFRKLDVNSRVALVQLASELNNGR